MFSSSSPVADPPGSLWLQGSSQQTRTEAKALLAAAETLNQEERLPISTVFLTDCSVFNHQEGSRSSATLDRRCSCLRPSSGSLLTLVLEAIRKQIGCQKWEAHPMSYSEAKTILRHSFRTEWRQRLDIGIEEHSPQLDRAAQFTIFRLRTGH